MPTCNAALAHLGLVCLPLHQGANGSDILHRLKGVLALCRGVGMQLRWPLFFIF